MTFASYQLFVNALANDKSADTKKCYIDRFGDFCERQHIRDTDALTKLEPRAFEDKIKAYIDDRLATSQRLSYSFLNQVVSAVRYFCLANRINLNFDWIYLQIPKPDSSAYPASEVVEQKPYRTDQIIRMIKAAKANKRPLAELKIMAQGGARVGALPTLMIEDMQLVEPYGCLALKAYPKTKAVYWIILPPKAGMSILAYVGDRKHGHLLLNDEQEHVTRRTVTHDMERLAINSGVRKVHKGDNLKRHEIMLDHGLRKWHSTALEKAGIKDDHINRLRGGKKGLKGIYQLPTPLEIIELVDYQKAIPYLDILEPMPVIKA